MSEGARWYVVSTHPNRENVALANLLRQGFDAFLPSYYRLRRHARRLEKVLRPFFPGYLFVRLDVAKSVWRPILATVGVAELVRCGLDPQPVQKGVVEAIMDDADENGVIKISPAPEFQAGQPLRVLEGVFAGAEGIYSGMADDERIMVLLSMLGRPLRVSAEQSAVEAVGP